MDFGATFDQGLSYREFLDRYGSDEHRRRWRGVYEQVVLTAAQRDLLRSFQREMKVLVTAGAWCGDCVNQCPIFARFEEASDRIRVRFFDRDDQSELSQELAICGAPRVPSVLFLSEDDFPCGRYGDRTLAKYRQLAGSEFGPACPTGIVAPERALLEAVTQEWLDEFERIQLMLRTSGRLRQKHGD
ncbi:MAG TPA: thioredoxin family protein [Planctomycetaceae bacterium]|nr:thioredoxin family protein [Planctomycetaceae bacterium]